MMRHVYSEEMVTSLSGPRWWSYLILTSLRHLEEYIPRHVLAVCACVVFTIIRTSTPVWIHKWLRNDAKKLEVAKKMCPMVFQGHLLNYKVTQEKKSPNLTQIGRFWAVNLICLIDGYHMMLKACISKDEVPYYFSMSSVTFQGPMGQKVTRIGPFRIVIPVWIHQWLFNAQFLT